MDIALQAPAFVADVQHILLQMGRLLEPTFDPSFIETSFESFENEFQENAAYAVRMQYPESLERGENIYSQRFSLFAHQLEVLSNVSARLQAKRLPFQVNDIALLEGAFHAAAYDAIGESDYLSFGSHAADVFVESLALYARELSIPPSDLLALRLSYKTFLDGMDLMKELKDAVAADELTIPYRPDLSVLDDGSDGAEFRGDAQDDDMV